MPSFPDTGTLALVISTIGIVVPKMVSILTHGKALQRKEELSHLVQRTSEFESLLNRYKKDYDDLRIRHDAVVLRCERQDEYIDILEWKLIQQNIEVPYPSWRTRRNES